MNLDYNTLAVIFIAIALLTTIRYLILRKHRNILHKEDKKVQEFITSFNPSSFSDFSLFDFKTGSISYVSPFQNKESEEWRYTIFLSQTKTEDLTTITHEITECTIGRLIEKLLNLEKPLYLKRKREGKFWVHGKRQKYLLEHMITTLTEIGQVDSEELKERLAKEDFKELIE